MKAITMKPITRNLLLALLLAAAPFAGAQAEKAINFQFVDVTGRQVQLSDFKGKWVLVNFWAPWCPLCWSEVPLLNELNRRDDFAVVAIGLDYGPDQGVVQEAAERHDFVVASIIAGGARRDPGSPFRQVGPVDFYPTSYLYAPDGEIVMFIPGLVKRDKLLAFMQDWQRKRRAGK